MSGRRRARGSTARSSATATRSCSSSASTTGSTRERNPRRNWTTRAASRSAGCTFNKGQKRIGPVNEQKDEERVPLESIGDIFKHAEQKASESDGWCSGSSRVYDRSSGFRLSALPEPTDGLRGRVSVDTERLGDRLESQASLVQAGRLSRHQLIAGSFEKPAKIQRHRHASAGASTSVALYYSNHPDEGLLYVCDAAWIDGKGAYVELNAHGILLTRKDDIREIVFLHDKATWRSRPGPDWVAGSATEPRLGGETRVTGRIEERWKRRQSKFHSRRRTARERLALDSQREVRPSQGSTRRRGDSPQHSRESTRTAPGIRTRSSTGTSR